MNVIGQMGKFIMEYQEPILIGVIVAFVIAVICIIGKLIANANKKRKMFVQMSEDISEINASVKALSEKKTEVIYIDGRTSPASRMIRRDPASMQAVSAYTHDSVEEAIQLQPEAAVGSDDQAPALKYFSRDCGLSKDGRMYTIEELDAQIKD